MKEDKHIDAILSRIAHKLQKFTCSEQQEAILKITDNDKHDYGKKSTDAFCLFHNYDYVQRQLQSLKMKEQIKKKQQIDKSQFYSINDSFVDQTLQKDRYISYLKVQELKKQNSKLFVNISSLEHKLKNLEANIYPKNQQNIKKNYYKLFRRTDKGNLAHKWRSQKQLNKNYQLHDHQKLAKKSIPDPRSKNNIGKEQTKNNFNLNKKRTPDKTRIHSLDKSIKSDPQNKQKLNSKHESVFSSSFCSEKYLKPIPNKNDAIKKDKQCKIKKKFHNPQIKQQIKLRKTTKIKGNKIIQHQQQIK